MAEEPHEYVEVKLQEASPSFTVTPKDLKTSQITMADSKNHVIYSSLVSVEFMISTLSLVFYVALNSSPILIILSVLGLVALGGGCVLSYLAISKMEHKKQTLALIVFGIATILCSATSIVALTKASGFNPSTNALFDSRVQSENVDSGEPRVLQDYYYPYGGYPYNGYPYGGYGGYYHYCPFSYGYGESFYVSTSYNVIYTFGFDRFSYSYTYSSSSGPYGSSYFASSSSSQEDCKTGHDDYDSQSWSASSSTHKYGGTYNFYNPYTGSTYSYSTYNSPDQMSYDQGPGLILDRSGDQNNSSGFNDQMFTIVLFALKSLVFVGLIAQGIMLRKTLTGKTMIQPQKITAVSS